MRVLAGDVGGTSTRLALFEGEPGHFSRKAIERYPSASAPHLLELITRFLADVDPAPDAVGFGVAGPVSDGVCKATNLPWIIDARQLAGDLGVARVALVNDFEAVALGVGALEAGDVCVLQDHPADPMGLVAILGAGTGLGEALIVPGGDGSRRVVPTEGGHTDFAARDETEIELLKFLRARHGRVSVERVVSGRGLHALYDFVVESGRAPTTDAVRGRLEAGAIDPGAVIGEAALAGADQACVLAVQLFVSAYGAEAGNLALKCLPTGGIFVAGGIAPKLLPFFEDGRFTAALCDKGRMSPLVAQLRVSLVLNSDVGLLGARAAALQGP